MELGFSYVGFVMLAMLFIPNFFWTKNQPKNYTRYVKNESPALRLLERVGEVAVTALSLIFTGFNLRAWEPWNLWLAGAAILMVLYELYWLRYFRSEKAMRDFYTSFWGIPLAGATLPVAAFFLLALYGKNIFLAAATIILGVGHIGIHMAHKKEIEKEKQ